jgi:hypothetical protein
LKKREEIKMSNSSLVNYVKRSPNCNVPRNHKIDTITIHHMAGNLTVEQCGELFANPAREVSSNYAIGTDGRVALYVDEVNRSWCTSSPENDNRAITIEVANDGGAPDWHVSDKALAKLIDLCVDICKRNGIKKLNYTGDKSGNMTMHKWFAATGCPGPYLGGKFPYIAAEVNKRLAAADKKILDKKGYVKGDSTIGVYAFKLHLIRAKKLGIVKQGVNADKKFGEGTKKAVNELLKKWGYAQNGIAGEKFITKLNEEIDKKM